MRIARFAALLLLTFAFPVAAEDLKATGPAPIPTELARLIEQLGDRDYGTREAAAKHLETIGQPALAPLEAATQSDSPEVAERAAMLRIRIHQRLANEAVLAPTIVELPDGEQTVSLWFALIENQTRYKLRIEGDQATLSQKVKLPAGKRPFWEVVQQVCDATGLEVAAVTSPGLLISADSQSRVSAAEQLRQQADSYTRQLDTHKKYRQNLKDQVDELRKAHDAETDAQKKAVIAKALKSSEARLQEFDGEIARIEQQLTLQKDISLGMVMLRAKSGTNGKSVSHSGAVRVAASAANAEVSKRYKPEHLPLTFKVFPEPRMSWQSISEIGITEAVGADGCPLRPTYFRPRTYNSLANDELQFRRARLGLQESELLPGQATTGYAALIANTSGTPATLKSLRGLIRGNVWSAPTEIVSVSAEEVGAAVSNCAHGVALQLKVFDGARVLPDNSVLIEIVLSYPPNTVRLDTDRPGTKGEVWFEQQGGRVIVRNGGLQPANPRVNTPSRPFGLTVYDQDGNPLTLSQVSSSTMQTVVQQQLLIQHRLQYYVRPTERGTPAKIGSVSFRGSRLAEVTVPFQLTDVAVSPGTGDGSPQPDDIVIYSK
jgi:hypothetical protein